MTGCGGASAAIGVVHLNLTQGLVIGIALIVVGILINAGLARWVEEGDEREAAEQRAAENQALRMVTKVTAPYSGAQIPAQRVTNGEDLLGGDPR